MTASDRKDMHIMSRKSKPGKIAHQRRVAAERGVAARQKYTQQQAAERRQRGRHQGDWPGMIRLPLPPSPRKADDDA